MNYREEVKQLHIRLPSEVYKQLKLKCVHEDISMQEYVAKLLTENLEDFPTGKLLADRKID